MTHSGTPSGNTDGGKKRPTHFDEHSCSIDHKKQAGLLLGGKRHVGSASKRNVGHTSAAPWPLGRRMRFLETDDLHALTTIIIVRLRQYEFCWGILGLCAPGSRKASPTWLGQQISSWYFRWCTFSRWERGRSFSMNGGGGGPAFLLVHEMQAVLPPRAGPCHFHPTIKNMHCVLLMCVVFTSKPC